MMLRYAEWKTKHSPKTRQTNCKLKIKKDPVHKNIMQIKATLINEDSFVPDDASSISGGNIIFIYSCSTQLISFKIKSISKETICAEHGYMNLSPPPSYCLMKLYLQPLIKESFR